MIAFGKLKNIFILTGIVVCCCATATSAIAQEAILTNIKVTNTRDDILIYLDIEGCFNEKSNKAVMSGVSTSFSVYFNLHQVRHLWPDKAIKDRRLTHTSKYDNLKKQFSIDRPWKSGKPVVTTSFEEAKKMMSKVDGYKMIPIGELEKGRQYRLRTKAEVSKITLPFYLHYVLVFVSLWDFETDWYTIDFTY